MKRLAILACWLLLGGQVHDHNAMPAWLTSHPDFASCCHGRDCETVRVKARAVAGGWIITHRGRTYPPFPYDRTKVSQDQDFHACALPGAETLFCLWVPPSSV